MSTTGETTAGETGRQGAIARFPGRFRRWLFAAGTAAGLIGWAACAPFIPHPRYAEIRIPGPDEQVPLELFHWNSATRIRSIATITTCFTRDTWLTTDVYSIENGKTLLVAHKVTGRSSKYSRPTDPYLMTFPVTFALADARTDEGHTTLLAMRGASRSSGNFGGVHDEFEIRATKMFAGRIDPGENRLLYVEGDREFAAMPEMTSDDFVARNAEGRFLVVVLRFVR